MSMTGKTEPSPKKHCDALTARIRNNYWTRSLAEREREEAIRGEREEAEPEYSVETDPSEGEEEELQEKQQPSYPERREELSERHKALLETLLTKVKFDDALINSFLEHPKWPEPLKNALREKRNELGTAEMHKRRRCPLTRLRVITEQRGDPGRFTLPCIIGYTSFPGCLCDLGASVSVMPLSTARKLGFKRFTRCGFDIALADRSLRTPEGILEGVPVKIKGFLIPTDFVVMRMDEEGRDPLIFGRPFLATTKAIINIMEKSVCLRLEDEVLRFRIEEN